VELPKEKDKGIIYAWLRGKAKQKGKFPFTNFILFKATKLLGIDVIVHDAAKVFLWLNIRIDIHAVSADLLSFHTRTIQNQKDNTGKKGLLIRIQLTKFVIFFLMASAIVGVSMAERLPR
jgi:hypothetical protein